MALIQRLDKVVAALRERAAKSKEEDNVGVSVGYTASYALFVHENMEPKTLGENVPRPSGIGFFWGPSGYGPKFLTGPLREFEAEIAALVRSALKAGQTMSQALLRGGYRLQRESQLRVPVEYGNLKQSAFTRLTDAS